MYVVFNVIELL